MGEVGEENKAAVKTFSLFFSSTPAGPLASLPPPLRDLFYRLAHVPERQGPSAWSKSMKENGPQPPHPHSHLSPLHPPHHIPGG